MKYATIVALLATTASAELVICSSADECDEGACCGYAYDEELIERVCYEFATVIEYKRHWGELEENVGILHEKILANLLVEFIEFFSIEGLETRKKLFWVEFVPESVWVGSISGAIVLKKLGSLSHGRESVPI